MDLSPQEPAPFTYVQGQVVSLPIKRQFETVEMEPEVSCHWFVVGVVVKAYEQKLPGSNPDQTIV